MQASPAEQEIVFSTWDLAGQHVYYATHQCFLTSNTLYLVVWNVQHGKEGLDRLAPWLLNIQVSYLVSILDSAARTKILESRRRVRLAAWFLGSLRSIWFLFSLIQGLKTKQILTEFRRTKFLRKIWRNVKRNIKLCFKLRFEKLKFDLISQSTLIIGT